MIKLAVADIVIEIFTDKVNILDPLKAFLTSENKKPDLKLSVYGCKYICEPKGKSLHEQDLRWFKNPYKKEEISVCMCADNSEEILYKLVVDFSCSKASINYLKDSNNGQYAINGPVGQSFIFTSIIYYEGIGIHAAAIDWNGRGVLFSAPSETGKSTQANLWEKYMGARILNGDRPVVRMVNNEAFVYGTPWSGSSIDFLNAKSPLRAIVLLEQSMENSIEKLEENHAVLKLMTRCFLPYFDKNLMKMAMENLDKIVKSTPVYLLKCRPDREAVELVYQCVR